MIVGPDPGRLSEARQELERTPADDRDRRLIRPQHERPGEQIIVDAHAPVVAVPESREERADVGERQREDRVLDLHEPRKARGQRRE